MIENKRVFLYARKWEGRFCKSKYRARGEIGGKALEGFDMLIRVRKKRLEKGHNLKWLVVEAIVVCSGYLVGWLFN